MAVPLPTKNILKPWSPKDQNTITITAHGFENGKDLTRDMILECSGDQITMEQGSLIAHGKKEDNFYALKGDYQGIEYRFRLYTLGDKFIFHRERWKDGSIQSFDMSYLVRQ